jgi:hypothetical protein
MNLISMLFEKIGKDGESEFCIGCSDSALTGVLKKGANIGYEPHFVCNFMSLKQEMLCLPCANTFWLQAAEKHNL